MNTFSKLCLVVAVVVMLPSLGFAKKNETGSKAVAPMTPEQQAQFEKMTTLASPNENHRTLDAFVGNWKYTINYWMAADAKPEETKGTTQTKWIMDGRFVEINVKGNMHGKPFHGVEIMGYDNIRKEYSAIWFDNMATGIAVSALNYDSANKTFKETRDSSCPMTGEAHVSTRGEIKWIDNDHFTYDTYVKDQKGKEFKNMAIQYERSGKKPAQVSQR